MAMYTEEITIKTSQRNQLILITDEVQRVVQKSAIKNGLVILFVPHTTAAITINENADPDVVEDMLMGLETISPNRDEYKHFEGNSDAHIKSSLVGVDQTLILQHSTLQLGMWQGIYFCEFDGQRTRRLKIMILGE